ncbi:hypothetical protein [Leptospira adleri]|uniref:Lipoprotein n=1 Tax=Leptospira adleri TaxID=2023186 RepID=A0A2M9YSX6_9LEPT|nr:hypothetical protein [Leptospira adleri]PJZ54610.1 hypothetical protein CH380_02475 [Leptospira adleri]PJZ59855.1 hypothetical protein CH376_21585 [Leptospira adleri]
MNFRIRIFFLILVSLLFSCVSTPVFIPESKIHAQNSNTISIPAYGKECGFLFFMFLPIGLSDRSAKAFSKVVAQAEGGSLSEVTFQESWYWALLGTRYCTTVTAFVTKGLP